MKRLVPSTTVLAWVLVAMCTLVAAPALAQETAPEVPGSGAAISVAPGEPPPDPVDFVFNEDGTVTIDGDTGASCRDFALLREEGYYRIGNQEQAQSVLEQCERAGFLSGDKAFTAAPPTQEQRYQYQQPNPRLAMPSASQSSPTRSVLPATGGVPLLLLAVGMVLVGAGIAAARRSRIA